MSRPIKRVMSLFLSLAMAVSLLPAVTLTAAATTDTWDGTADTGWYTANPAAVSFTIATAEELAGLASLVNAGTDSFSGDTLTLATELDLSAHEWTPIGLDDGTPFQGTFDGNDKTITGLTITEAAYAHSGLFGYVGSGGTVKDLTLADVNISSSVSVSGTSIGGVAGSVSGGRVENCSVTGSVAGYLCVGGVVGCIKSDASIEGCYAAGDVTSTDSYVGGVVGMSDAEIENCWAASDVESGCAYAGGVVGMATTITNCYATGKVVSTGDETSSNGVGGVAGYADIAQNCFATGDVSSANGSGVGGVVGLAGTVQYCWATGNVTGLKVVGGIVGDSWGTIENNAALNASVSGDSEVGRVVGSNYSSLSDNVAFAGMTITEGGDDKTVDGTNTHDGIDGADRSRAALQTDSGFPEALTDDPWTYAAAALPGLGQTVAMPPHLAWSADASLISVAGQSDNTPGAQSGADEDNAIAWEIEVASGKPTLAPADIAAAAGAAKQLYSDADFETEITPGHTLALTPGGQTTAYIKVTAADEPVVRYYAVTIARTVAPVLSVNEGLTVSQGREAAITASQLSAADADTSGASLVYTLETAPVNGTLKRATASLSAGETFTQDDIDESRVSYTHGGGETVSDSFTFTVSDGINALSAQTFAISVIPVDNEPFTRDITSFLRLGTFAEAHSAYGSYATPQIDNITLEIWVYLESTTKAHHVLINGNAVSNGYGIYIDNAAVNVLMGSVGRIYCSAGDSYDPAHGNVLTAGQWAHIAVTRNTADGGTDGWKVYVNGRPLATHFDPAGGSSGNPNTLDSNSYVQIGPSADPAGLSVSEARIWNKALSQGEIQANMSGAVPANAADLAGYWKLTDSSGAVIADIQTNKAALNLPVIGEITRVASTAGSTPEDTTLSGRLAGGDIETPVTYAKTSDPSHGTASVSANGAYTYTPAANFNGSDSFTFVVNDGFQNSESRTVNVTVIPVNDAPTISGGSYACTGTDEDTTGSPVTVSAILSGVSGQDVDGDSLGLAVTATAGSGAWQYSTNGHTWWDVAPVSSGAALLLSPATQLRYIPNGQNGETAALTFRAWDQTHASESTNGTRSTADVTTNGGSTAFSSGTAQTTVAVAAVNDAPVLTPAAPSLAGLTASQTDNAGQAVSSFAGIAISDVDAGAQKGVAIIATDDGGGKWQYSLNFAVTWTDVGAVDETAALLLRNTDRVRFVPGGPNPAQASLTYRAWDQSTGVQGEKADAIVNGAATAFSMATDAVSVTVSADASVTGVTSTNDDGAYKAGDTVFITVIFDKAVTVTGTPRLTLETGAVDRAAGYSSGSGTAVLSFTYIAQPGDESGDLDYVSAYALSVDGGAIQTGGADASLILPAPGTAGSLGANKAIAIDTAAPQAPSTPDLTAASDTGVSDTDDLTRNTTPVFTGTAEPNSTVTLYGTDGVTVLGTAAADGDGSWSIASSALAPGAHTVTAKAADAAGNVSAASSGLEITIDTAAPGVQSVDVPADGSYISGQSLAFTVNLDKAVTVAGTPRLALTIGASTVYADYLSGSGTNALVFGYTVAPGDVDTDGVTLGALTLNGGSMTDAAGNSAALALSGVGSTASVLVDTTAPTVVSVGVPPSGTYKAGDSLNFTVNFDEAVVVDATPRIALTIGASTVYADYMSGSGTNALTFSYAAVPGDVDTDGIAVGLLTLNGGSMTDAAGNSAALTLSGVASTAGVFVDAVAPSVSSINRLTPLEEWTNADSVIFRVTFSEGVTGVDISDFTLTKTGTADAATASVSASSGTVIDVTVDEISGVGTLRLDLNTGGTDIRDVAGNPLSGGYTGGQAYGIDSAAPTVTITSAAPDSTKTAPIPVTITFSEGVTGFALGDLTIGNGTAGNFVAVDAATYTAEITPSAQGTVTVDVAAGAAQDAAGNLNTAAAQLGRVYDAAAPVPGAGGTITVGTVSSSSAVLSWTAAADNIMAAAQLHYKVVYSTSDSIATPEDAQANGTVFADWTANLTSATVTGLTAVTEYYFNVLVRDAAGNEACYTAVSASTTRAHSGGSGSGGAQVLVNGQPQTAGTAQTATNSSGQTVTTVTVDTGKLESILSSQASGATVTIPVAGGSDVAAGALTGAMVRSMEDKDATLVIQTASGSYTLPASEINIGAVSQQLGAGVSLADIRVTVSVAEPSAAMAQVVENAAQDGGYTIVASAVAYTVTCAYGGRTVNIDSFSAYVERTVALPEGVDPAKITTGVVVDPDGTVHHVPTRVTVVDGKYYAVINSLTNSTYCVVWNPVEFSDMAGHWARDAVNEMGSRMVVTGIGDNLYAPDRSLTRAEFAAIIVRALGLTPGAGASGFGDVAEAHWSSGFIKTAAAYGIIEGYGDGRFGPNDTVTREQAMAMLGRAMKLTGLDAGLTEDEAGKLLGAYRDGSAVSAYAQGSVAACLKTGLTTGTGPATLSPKAAITRSEVAVMARRLLQKSGLI